MEELCGFIPGKGLSHEKCLESGQGESDPKTEESTKPECPRCGSHCRIKCEYNANCLNKEAGCDWRLIRLKCADCGFDLMNLEKGGGGKEDFKETAEMLEKLRGL